MQVGNLKLVLKKEKKLNTDSGCNSFKKLTEMAKNGTRAFKPLETILWVRDGLLSASRPDETYRVEAKTMKAKLPVEKFCQQKKF